MALDPREGVAVRPHRSKYPGTVEPDKECFITVCDACAERLCQRLERCLCVRELWCIDRTTLISTYFVPFSTVLPMLPQRFVLDWDMQAKRHACVRACVRA
jgi:hypothetical protein